MNNRLRMFSAAAIALLLLAACGTGGNIFGNNSNSDIRGTVSSIDTSSRTIYLTNASNSNGSMLSSGGGNSIALRYDNSTTVQWNGQKYRPQDLEPGDQIDASVSGSNNYASSITVTSNVRTSGTYPNNGYPNNGYPNNGYPNNGSYATTIHGTVRGVNQSRQTISLDPGTGGSYITVQFNGNTPVYYNGQTYQPGNLEVGDQVDVRGTMVNNGLLTAQDMTVTYSVSANNGTYGNNNGTYGTSMGTLQGTVSSVDTTNHLIYLNQTNWITGFDRSVSNGSTITVSYNPGVQVNVNGQMYAVNGLQRGDVINIQLQNRGGSNYVANGITLVHDVNARY